MFTYLVPQFIPTKTPVYLFPSSLVYSPPVPPVYLFYFFLQFPNLPLPQFPNLPLTPIPQSTNPQSTSPLIPITQPQFPFPTYLTITSFPLHSPFPNPHLIHHSHIYSSFPVPSRPIPPAGAPVGVATEAPRSSNSSSSSLSVYRVRFPLQVLENTWTRPSCLLMLLPMSTA